MGTNTDKLTTKDIVNAFYNRYRIPNERDRINIINSLGQHDYNHCLHGGRSFVWFSFGEQLYLSEEEYGYPPEKIFRGCLKVISEASEPETLHQYLIFSVVIPLDNTLPKDFYIGLGEAFTEQNFWRDSHLFINTKLGISRNDTEYNDDYLEDNMFFENQPVFIVRAVFHFNPNNPILQQSANDELLEDIITISEELRELYAYELIEHAYRNGCLDRIRL